MSDNFKYSKHGVYSLRNKISGNEYIGSAKDLYRRKNHHLYFIKKRNHANPNVNNEANLYGIDSFEFIVLEFISDLNKLHEREQYFMDLKNPKLNILKFAGSQIGNTNFKGKKHKPESILMQSGENGHNSKLTKFQVSDIRSKYIPRKYSMRTLAKEYSVSYQCIASIINNLSYKL